MAATASPPPSAASGDAALLFQSTPEAPEEVEASIISGAVPLWLHGALVRNGPGAFEVGANFTGGGRSSPLTGGGRSKPPAADAALLSHLFDGYALLHAVRFEGGRAWYRSRFLRSGSFTDAVAAGRPVRREFGTDPTQGCGSAGRLAAAVGAALGARAAPPASDNANVHVLPLLGRLVSSTLRLSPRSARGGRRRSLRRGRRRARSPPPAPRTPSAGPGRTTWCG
jgi:beta,beta-carotene 9',10'-dioxygenase